MIVTMLIAALVACGEPEPQVLTSTPRSPAAGEKKLKVDFSPVQDMGQTDLDPRQEKALVGFFPKGAVALPSKIGGLRPGQSQAEARNAFEAVRETRIELHEVGPSISGILRDVPEIQVMVLWADDGSVGALNLALPTAKPQRYLREAWGAPDASGEYSTWKNAETGLIAELIPPSGKDPRAVLRYRLAN